MSFGVPPQPQRPIQHAPQNAQDDGLGLIIPINVRNVLAVVSGYLGLLSLITGPLTGIPALITGILALRKPELGGQGRAWTGIVLGGLTTLGFVAFVLLATAVRSGPHR